VRLNPASVVLVGRSPVVSFLKRRLTLHRAGLVRILAISAETAAMQNG
jgi:hypothetical protein